MKKQETSVGELRRHIPSFLQNDCGVVYNGCNPKQYMDQIAQIREKINIVSFISEFIPLKQIGRNFKSNCPFHSEKSPSFVVSPERQIWHCFGCQKGGDAFTFLMEYEHLEFGEALRILAKRAGIELATSSFDTGVTSRKEVLYKINAIASEFYHYLLKTHPVGKAALSYIVEERKISPLIIDTFLIGFAPRQGSILTRYLLKKKGFQKDDILDSGLGSDRRGGLMDFFMNRIMFPLYDHRGNVIGFSGRIFNESSSLSPKYINTKETLVYHKGSSFFGLNVTKQEIKKENKALVMEGEFDVLSSFQEGIGNVLAVKGTALTEEQVHLLSRFTQKIALCLDKDKAGQDAIKRSLSFLEKKGIATSVVIIPDGKDPDESIKKDPYAFKKAVKQDMNAYEFLLTFSLQRNDKKTIEGKRKISEELLPIFSLIENEIIKEHFLKKLSNELDTSYESIVREIERKITKKSSVLTQAFVKEKKSREEILEEYIVSLILQSESPKIAFEKVIPILFDILPKVRSHQKILYQLLDFLKIKNVFDSNTFAQFLPKELLSAYDTSFVSSLPKFSSSISYYEELEKISKELRQVYLKRSVKELGDLIKKKGENTEESQEIDPLQKKLSEILTLIKGE